MIKVRRIGLTRIGHEMSSAPAPLKPPWIPPSAMGNQPTGSQNSRGMGSGFSKTLRVADGAQYASGQCHCFPTTQFLPNHLGMVRPHTGQCRAHKRRRVSRTTATAPCRQKSDRLGSPSPWPHACSGSGMHGPRLGSEWQNPGRLDLHKAHQTAQPAPPPSARSCDTEKPPAQKKMSWVRQFHAESKKKNSSGRPGRWLNKRRL